MVKRLLCGLFLVALTGCDSFSEADPMMQEYLDRLARVLEVEPVEAKGVPAAVPMPRRRERALALPELELGVLDFLSLYGCELQFVVGEKASVLGRVMQPINRLRYEVRFIRAAEDCLPDIDNEALHESVTEAIASKRSSLPVAVWNATWGTEEIERLLTLTKGYYPVTEGDGALSDLVRDLEQLNRMVDHLTDEQLDVSLTELGTIHQRWQAEFKAGQLINSARLLTATLGAGTELLQARLDQRPLCFNGRPNSQSDIVQNFFFNIYIGKIQPYMSDVSRARDSLIGELGRLAQQQVSAMPASFEPWAERYLWETPGSVWAELDAAMTRHTRHWQQLLEQCGLRPQA